MDVTAFSFILLPLCVVWMASPDNLLKLTAIAACFEAAAALIIGSYGLQPGLAVAVTFMAYVILQMLLGVRYPGLNAVSRVMLPFVLITVYAVITSYLMPRIFEFQAYVFPQKVTPTTLSTPLSTLYSDVNQDLYLVNNCAFMFLAALYLTKSKLSLAPFIRAYFLGGFVVAAISVWQFVNRMTGLPFPETLFYSNPNWAILTDQAIGEVPRINGPFSEPSALASYMASIVCATGWLLLQGRHEKSIWLLFVTGLLTMVISTSTTGFAVLAIVGAGVPITMLLTRSARMMASLAKVGLPLAIVGGVAFVLAGIFIPSIYDNVREIVTATFDKQDSTSYNDRTNADLGSLTAVMDTYGLGVGWGSNRSSSLIPGLLAALGIPGFLVLLWFVAGVWRTVRAARRIGGSDEQRLVIDACAGALVGFLLSAVLSAPTVTSTVFFLLLALLIACATRVQLDAGAVARRQTVRRDAVRSVGVMSGQGLDASNAVP